MVTVNVVVLAGIVSADPVQRRMPSGDEVTELRLSVPEAGKTPPPPPDRGLARHGRRPSARRDRQRRSGARAWAVGPPLLPERCRSPQPHRGGRERHQEARPVWFTEWSASRL